MRKSIRTKEYKEFVQKLREARLKASLTQVQVAKRLRIAQSFVSKVEAGEQRVDVVELRRFARLYKKPIEWFIKI